MELISYWQRYCAPYLRARGSRSERGASMVEYALLVALIAVVCIGAVQFVGRGASDSFSHVGAEVGKTATTTGP